MQFTPLKDFFSDEFKSQYLVGLSYTVRPQDSILAAIIPQWIEQGLVRLGAPDAPVSAAKVAGTGKVE